MENQNAKTSAPAIFFGHGSPTTILTDNDATRGWQEMVSRFERPKAIICVSAHWYTRGTFVTSMERPRTIHDFGPLSPSLFEMQYPAPGAPELAKKIQSILAPTKVELDTQWGFDHGTWTVMSKIYPEADIPIVQLSIDGQKSPQEHLSLARKLQPLRDQGILIVGSGNIVHNLSVLEWRENVKPYDWAIRFRDYILDHIKVRDFDAVCSFRDLDGDADLSVPHPDHFLPLLYVLGASSSDDQLSIETDFFEFKSLSMTSLMYRGA